MRLTWEVIKLALDTLRGNKVRSFLTIVGVIIGTGTIIAVGSILVGFDGAVTGTIQAFGTNTAIVYKARIGVGAISRTNEERMRKPLTYEDAKAIEERCPSVEHVSPVLNPPNNGVQRAKYKGNDYFQPQLIGTDEKYITEIDMRDGRFFTDSDSMHRLPLVVVGEDVARALFGAEEPIGKKILVAGHELEVVGVMNRPATQIPGQDDRRMLVPYFTFQKIFPTAQENILFVHAKKDQLPAAIDELRVVLRQTRHVAFNKDDNFFISTADQLVEQFRSLTSVIALVMVVLSSIGLLVGGIGVMNIMLVSVTERTREIGIRKAIGARRSNIVFQFLIEAVVLTGMGGLIGMLFGWGVSTLARIAFPSLPTTVPAWAVIAGIAVSVGIGLFFGIWPASKAARLDPVEALRYE